MPKWFLLLVVISAPHTAAQEVIILLWNAEPLFDVDSVTARSADLQAFGAQFPDADIVILDEVTSSAVVNAARSKVGSGGFNTA